MVYLLAKMEYKPSMKSLVSQFITVDRIYIESHVDPLLHYNTLPYSTWNIMWAMLNLQLYFLAEG